MFVLLCIQYIYENMRAKKMSLRAKEAALFRLIDDIWTMIAVVLEQPATLFKTNNGVPISIFGMYNMQEENIEILRGLHYSSGLIDRFIAIPIELSYINDIDGDPYDVDFRSYTRILDQLQDVYDSFKKLLYPKPTELPIQLAISRLLAICEKLADR